MFDQVGPLLITPVVVVVVVTAVAVVTVVVVVVVAALSHKLNVTENNNGNI